MPEHSFPVVIVVGSATLADAAWPWQQISAGTHADSGAGVPAAGAVKVNPLLNPLLIGALGSGKSAMHGFVVGGGEDR